MTGPTPETARRRRRGPGFGALVVLLGGCAAPGPPPANVELPLEQAIAAATDNLVEQARRLAAFRAGAPRALTAADTVIDATNGEQTVATALVDRRVAERLAERLDAAEPVPLDAANLPRAHFLLTGTLARTDPDRPRGTVRLDLALTELKTGRVVAQAWALARGDGVDAAPLPCDADSPVRLHDDRVDALVTTSATVAGRPAAPYLLERLAAEARLAEANRRCNADQPAEAFVRYKRAAAEAGGDSPRVLNGLYVTGTRLGRSAEAEQAFDRLVAAGLANRRFELRFLFNPGSTVPTPDRRYSLWLRRIARASAAARVCLQIVGHGSRAGTPSAVDTLALQRAAFVRQRLIGEAAVLGNRLRAIGPGDVRRPVDRADAVGAPEPGVDFRVVGCG